MIADGLGTLFGIVVIAERTRRFFLGFLSSRGLGTPSFCWVSSVGLEAVTFMLLDPLLLSFSLAYRVLLAYFFVSTTTYISRK